VKSSSLGHATIRGAGIGRLAAHKDRGWFGPRTAVCSRCFVWYPILLGARHSLVHRYPVYGGSLSLPVSTVQVELRLFPSEERHCTGFGVLGGDLGIDVNLIAVRSVII